jgi:hypothetical protein
MMRMRSPGISYPAPDAMLCNMFIYGANATIQRLGRRHRYRPRRKRPPERLIGQEIFGVASIRRRLSQRHDAFLGLLPARRLQRPPRKLPIIAPLAAQTSQKSDSRTSSPLPRRLQRFGAICPKRNLPFLFGETLVFLRKNENPCEALRRPSEGDTLGKSGVFADFVVVSKYFRDQEVASSNLVTPINANDLKGRAYKFGPFALLARQSFLWQLLWQFWSELTMRMIARSPTLRGCCSMPAKL